MSSGWKFDSVQDHDPNLLASARYGTVIRPGSDIQFTLRTHFIETVT